MTERLGAKLAEAFRERRYKRAFIAKLSDSKEESAETQAWLDFARDSKHITPKPVPHRRAARNNGMNRLM